MSIKLGDKVRDLHSGFTGIATSRVEFLTGCIQYAVQPPHVKKGESFPDAVYLDECRLENLTTKKKPAKDLAKGGPSAKVSAPKIPK